MKRRNLLLRKPFQKFSERYRRIDDSIVSLKTIAIVLLTVFVPTVLIAVLAVVAVTRAEPSVRAWMERPIKDVLFQLQKELAREWNDRLVRYAGRLAAEGDLHRHLRDLAAFDPYVRDVVLHEDGDFRRIEPESPFVRLEPSIDHVDLSRAWALEFREGDHEAALAAYRRLLEGAEPEVEVAALSGVARTLIRLGERHQAVDTLRRLIDRFGHAEDGSGIPHALPALWRLVELHREAGEIVPSRTAARDLSVRLAEWRPWLADDVLRRYRSLLEIYRRQTGYYALELEEIEVESPISTLIVDPRDRGRLLAHARQVLEGSKDEGYDAIPVADGGRAELAWFRLDGNADRVVYLILDAAGYLGDIELFTGQLGVPAGRIDVDVPREAAGDAPSQVGPVSSPFPRPFEHRRILYQPSPDQIPDGLTHLGALEMTGIIWAIVVLVLTILLGVLITVRSILQEMQISKLKTDFVSFVSHELKTPLTAIRMFSEMLLTGRVADRDEEKKCVELIDKEASRLSRLIGQILEFSQIEKRQQVFHFTSCDMSEVVAEAVKIFRDQNPDEDIEIVVNQAQHISRIRMDRSAMIELLLNLFSNAYKYSRGERRRIIVNLRESIDDIMVEVIDFGVGIPKAEHRKIFDKFYRAQDYLTREIEGTGLGLTFAKYIADVHNGEIKVSSVVDQGSTFTLELRKEQVLAE